ncbi:ADP-ribosylation factor-like protein 3 [Gigantopelta aegis]|uniref:ADP-ribosylation factor-like protein 3 n=1 Tax=Gigantopelta aegis TaxID=1735272 RepID=UPI001B88A100|nr:ADP-ribosylation factor-like protein 3 [Gigantopelta aegis]
MGGSSSVPIKILIIGPVNAGKTYLLRAMHKGVGKVVAPNPTDTYNVEIISCPRFGEKFMVYDLCGKPGMRLRRRQFYDATQGVILMVNCADMANIEEAKKDLEQLVEAVDLRTVPILVVANMVNTPGAASIDDIKDALQLNMVLANRSWEICRLRKNNQPDVDHILDQMLVFVYRPR